MNPNPYPGITQKVLASVAVLFGAVTMVAGTRVLTGFDPGYLVFRPLLLYNTVMGVVYIGVGASAWHSLRHGRNGAAAIFLLNLLVLAAIGMLYSEGGAVAPDSLRAMSFRTVVWLVIFLGLRQLGRRAP